MSTMEGSKQHAAPPPEFLKGGWAFSVVGTLISIPVGIRRKSLTPLVFFSTTGAMLDIILSTQYHEWEKKEHARLQKDVVEQSGQEIAPGRGDVILRDDQQTE